MQEYKMPKREQNSNKGTFGKVLNFCGSKNYVGAAYLSTLSSLKVGAGFSALASTDDVIKSVSVMLPEAVYLSREEGEALKKENAELMEKIEELKKEPPYKKMFNTLLFFNFLCVLAYVIGEYILN